MQGYKLVYKFLDGLSVRVSVNYISLYTIVNELLSCCVHDDTKGNSLLE